MLILEIMKLRSAFAFFLHHTGFGVICLLILFSACSFHPKTPEYRRFYAHLRTHKPTPGYARERDNYLLLLVSSRQLDYTDGRSLLTTMAKHPSDGSKTGDVGHAWILLKGRKGKERFVMEGGHSGELGIRMPRYFDGVMNAVECGDLEPNPVSYLWQSLDDGFFQQGSGGHRPTYAVQIPLSYEKALEIKQFIENGGYDFSIYSLREHQCAAFVQSIAALAGVDLEVEAAISIPATLSFANGSIVLWEDPLYSSLTVGSPDLLEKSLMRAVDEKRALYALPFYQKRWMKRRCPLCHMRQLQTVIRRLPERSCRLRMFVERKAVLGHAHAMQAAVDIHDASRDG